MSDSILFKEGEEVFCAWFDGENLKIKKVFKVKILSDVEKMGDYRKHTLVQAKGGLLLVRLEDLFRNPRLAQAKLRINKELSNLFMAEINENGERK